MRVSRITLVVAVGAALLLPASATSAAPLQHITACGQIALTNAVLDTDLDCTGTGLDGIIVGAPNITIDLDDNDLESDESVGLDGIDNTAGHAKVRVTNGGIFDFDVGINAPTATKNSVIDVLVAHNNEDGIFLGTSSVVKFVTSQENGDDGFDIGSLSKVSFVVAAGNAEDGFDSPVSAHGISIKEVNASNNVDDGINLTGDDIKLSSLDANGNGGDGIFVEGARARLSNLGADGNGGDGIGIDGSNASLKSLGAAGNDDAGISIEGDFASLKDLDAQGNDLDGIFIEGDSAKLKSLGSSGNDLNGIHIVGGLATFKNVETISNGYVAGVGDDNGLGVLVTASASGHVDAFGNDDDDQCDPTILCDD